MHGRDTSRRTSVHHAFEILNDDFLNLGLEMAMRTTLNIKVTVDSNVRDCYELRDSVAAAFLGIKQVVLCDKDDVETEVRFQVVEVDMPRAGHYMFTPENKHPGETSGRARKSRRSR